ncbi:putative Ig domain-containing protein, partial [Salmonella sp. SAL4357]|uniref:putative Ig domain-containing protein n=1 Tax=Salmonella sp. SAL4357 TaxID=3159878 RepID=UPI00397E9034
GIPYSTTLTVTDGVGPFTFGAVDLPPGITLNGQTGVLSGTPLAAGTFFCGLSVYDPGENNKVVKVVPLLVEPASSTFQFTT